MKMSLTPRVGLWGNYGYLKPFRSVGRWVGGQLPDLILGTKLKQDLMEGLLEYHVECLYDREKPKRDRVEMVLVLDTRDPKIREAMWLYETWKKEVEDARSGENDQGSSEPLGQSDVPW